MVEPRRCGKGTRTNTLRRFTVSSFKTGRTPRRIVTFGAQAKDAAAQAVPMGKRAGTTAVHGVRRGVHGAREWTAPRLEDAADALTASVAPRVSSALRSTANQVRPEGSKSGRTGLRRLLTWRWLLGAGAAITAAGVSAALAMRRRYASATAEIHDDDESPDVEAAPGHEAADEAAAQSEANGSRVSKSRK
jgi:hypothetical protein